MRMLLRYKDGDRVNHWIVALLFLCAGLSGLAFFHPAFYFFSALFGGGPWTRILHPFFGVAMFLGFVGLFFRFRKRNVWKARDSAWMRESKRLLRGDEDGMPEVGKNNAGQKLVFWGMGICLVLLLVTGVMFWQPWFADGFPILARRIAVVLHALSATVLILIAIVHIYAAIWVKGSVHAMTRGTVSEAWARKHHLVWYREMTGDK
ncbi:formate dehydrogenase subunit gamma [Pelomonas sp. KK5]|uniref:formate dehydrogenase subunit gamma n=1 Tax=Pelomonas sp. KK5 TaxID=1855730 RepID=UPI00097C0502|nr:formate dehydrogenase subunit gamma [Pelomonas sp. KK5]